MTFTVDENAAQEIPVLNNIILKQNYPNPFNPKTVISYQISDIQQISLKVYNARGDLLKTLIDRKQNSGSYEVEFDGSQYSRNLLLHFGSRWKIY
ncbi:MAG: hypothetical protein IPL53_21005 [Ignavibacteria bacterium]|nr:hypothetical protein [Ignavibacteria bacterium]